MHSTSKLSLDIMNLKLMAIFKTAQMFSYCRFHIAQLAELRTTLLIFWSSHAVNSEH